MINKINNRARIVPIINIFTAKIKGQMRKQNNNERSIITKTNKLLTL